MGTHRRLVAAAIASAVSSLLVAGPAGARGAAPLAVGARGPLRLAFANEIAWPRYTPSPPPRAAVPALELDAASPEPGPDGSASPVSDALVLPPPAPPLKAAPGPLPSVQLLPADPVGMVREVRGRRLLLEFAAGAAPAVGDALLIYYEAGVTIKVARVRVLGISAAGRAIAQVEAATEAIEPGYHVRAW